MSRRRRLGLIMPPRRPRLRVLRRHPLHLLGRCKSPPQARLWPPLNHHPPLQPNWRRRPPGRITSGQAVIIIGTERLGSGFQECGLCRRIVELCGSEAIGTIAADARSGCAGVGVEKLERAAGSRRGGLTEAGRRAVAGAMGSQLCRFQAIVMGHNPILASGTSKIIPREMGSSAEV